ncbi:MAG: DDE-type integrase/transposase/recombinase [Erythrobacteraceae bacterium]|nr:DDE-type integrase/transposase/recombinase [Erythrobacteraceae bacterium]
MGSNPTRSANTPSTSLWFQGRRQLAENRPMFAADIRRQRVSRMKGFQQWRWHLDEVFVNINGERHYLWRAVDHEGEVLESYVTKKRDRSAALAFLKKALKRHGGAETIVTDGLKSYPAAIRELGNL